MPRVVGLARCSTDLQIDSMPVQLNQIIEGALRLGLPEPELLKEPIGTSGVSTVFRQRPEGCKLWYQLTKGDTLIVSKIDRLGRKTRSHQAYALYFFFRLSCVANDSTIFSNSSRSASRR